MSISVIFIFVSQFFNLRYKFSFGAKHIQRKRIRKQANKQHLLILAVGKCGPHSSLRKNLCLMKMMEKLRIKNSKEVDHPPWHKLLVGKHAKGSGRMQTHGNRGSLA
ncbi:hypothetical protein NMG60_11035434 [Bertholletia excelsa]